MAQTLHELITNRKELIESHKKNNFTDGIHSLLTDLYPDTAHFIYELLQNAEDMDASEVRFVLKADCLYFEHNGAKRNFTLDDIDAITNIGHNALKKNDKTAIGKFGVGFKAVFAYTATPEIHSGKYHFQIHDYFVPVIEGVKTIPTRDELGIEWTKFYFPFNNPVKKPAEALKEIEKGLKEIDENSLLFLRHIVSISYTLLDGSTTVLTRTIKQNDITTLTYCTVDLNNNHSSDWLCFHKEVSIADENSIQKRIDVAVAYQLKRNEKTGKLFISPVNNAKTYIYFPAEKEVSHLQFHINAAFASTVARDSIRDCEQNKLLFIELAKLVTETLEKIKKYGFLSIDFLSILPNTEDSLSPYYEFIRDAINEAFSKKEYLPDRQGGYKTANEAICGPVDISELFTEDIVEEIFGEKFFWIQRPNNNRGLTLIRDLNVIRFEHQDFSDLFESNWEEGLKIEQIVKKRDLKWLRRFYLLCDKLSHDNYELEQDLKMAEIFQAGNGFFYSSDNIYVGCSENHSKYLDVPVLNLNELLSGLSEKEKRILTDFIFDTLEIQEYGEKAEIEAKLNSFLASEDRYVNDAYFDFILECAKFSKENPKEIDFRNKSIFLYEKQKEDSYTLTTAEELVLGKEYGNENGELIAKSMNKHCLFSGYKEHYSDEDLSIFKEFAQNCGIVSSLLIKKRQAELHPKFRENLSTGGQYTEYGISVDYFIDGLEQILKNISLQRSKMIWETLQYYGKKCSDEKSSQNNHYTMKNYPAYHIATYRSNRNYQIKQTDSSLIYYLKNKEWLYDASGKVFKPEDILIENLSDEYEKNLSNPLLKALKIGSLITAEAKERRKFEDELDKEGKAIISKDRLAKLEEYERKEQKKVEAKRIKTIEEGINSENQDYDAYGDDDSEDEFVESTEYVSNSKKRERNIVETFSNEMKSDEKIKRHFSTVYPSNKEEKEKLLEWYKGSCQICGEKIIKHNNKPFFVANNIMSSSMLPEKIKNTEHLCWNSLSLCPNCAAKYNYCQKDMSSFLEQVYNAEIENFDDTPIKIKIILAGKNSEITFVPKHFFDMQTILKNFNSIVQNESNSTSLSTDTTIDISNEKHSSEILLNATETKVPNQTSYLMFKWLEHKTKNCPRDNGKLEKKYVTVQKKNGTYKKLLMNECTKCKKLFMVRGELSNTINLSDYYISDGTYPQKQQPKKEEDKSAQKQVQYIFQTSKKGLELNHIYNVIKEDDDYYFLEGIEGRSMKKCFAIVNSSSKSN